MTNHQVWYFLNYDALFGRFRAYENEVAALNGEQPIANLSVQEIGAGTGHHAGLLLGYRPSFLELLDSDPQAVQILQTRFARCRQVHISQADGFALHNWPHARFDLVIAMFSILQQAESERQLVERIENVLPRLAATGCFAFEYVDTDVSRALFVPDHPSTIADSPELHVSIWSEHLPRHTVIHYRGFTSRPIHMPVDYAVPLFNLTRQRVDELAIRLGCSSRQVALSPDNRRQLCFFRKGSNDR